MAGIISDSVKKCVAIFKAAKTDTEKFAGLFMVTKIVKGSDCNTASKRALLEAIGFQFLKRLLLSSDVPVDCPPMMYKSVALNVLSSFCNEPEIVVHPEIISNTPVFLEIVSMSDDDDFDDNLMVIGEAYKCLLNIACTSEGQQALFEVGGVKKMCEIYSQQSFQTDSALNILVMLVSRFGPSSWQSDIGPFNAIMTKIALDYETDQSERKFELCTILYSLVASCPKKEVAATVSDEIWPQSIYTGLVDTLTSKVGKNQRDPALKLVSVMLEVCGVEWALSDPEKPKQFFLLLVQLCSIEVRMQLENKSIKQLMPQAELITACFASLELSLAYIAEDTLDLDQKEKQSLYTALKGAFNAVLNTLALFQKEQEKNKQLPIPEKLLAIALVRVLGAWLAQETQASRNAVYAIFPYVLNIANETFYASRERRIRERLQEEASKAGGFINVDSDPVGSVDVLRFLLPALCHLTVDEKPRKIMLEKKEEEIFYEALAYHWTYVLLKPPKIPKAERLKMKNIPEHQFTPRQTEDMNDSRAAMISLCNIFMNLTVLEADIVENSTLFATLLKFIFSKVPDLRDKPDSLVLSGNLSVLGLLLLKQQSKKVEKDDFAICRFIQSSIRFLWDAYCVDESVDRSGVSISIRYKAQWNELMELWFLGMQTLSAVLALVPWVSEFAMESGWPQAIIAMLKQVRPGTTALPANTKSAYEDFLCNLVAANNNVAKVLIDDDALSVCRTHRLMDLGKKLFGD